ncbi:MAG: DUF2845 domain-containing protein [Methylococcales bacterium]|nr:DUF2845 domain-containing protein [Methylococcales bacterium]
MAHKIKPSRYWLLLLSLIISQPALALRCGAYVINEGMDKSEVYHKCGSPTSVESHIEKRSSGHLIQNQQYYGNQKRAYPDSRFTYEQNNSTQIDVIIEEWTYNFGSSRIQQSLRFENGKLMGIRNLGRGY